MEPAPRAWRRACPGPERCDSRRDHRLAVDGRALLTDLLAVGGGAGAESAAADVLRRAWAPLADEVGGDALGSVWALRRGTVPGRPLLIAAHLDVVGLVVTRRLPGGFLCFAPVGGVDARSLLGREVVVAGRRAVPAVVATLPPHVTTAEGRRRIPPLEDLVLDTGCDDRDLAAAVRPGDRAHFAGGELPLQAEALAGAGLDNRAGVAALHEALWALRRAKPALDVYLLANVQEEVGMRGIAAAGRALRPRAAVVVDVGFGRQVGADAHVTRPVGQGPVLAMGPSLHPAVNALLAGEAERRGLPLQREVLAGNSGTDAWALQVAAGGIPVALLSIPLRSMHSPAEVVDYRDIRETGQLLASFVTAASEAWAAGLVTPLLGAAHA